MCFGQFWKCSLHHFPLDVCGVKSKGNYVKINTTQCWYCFSLPFTQYMQKSCSGCEWEQVMLENGQINEWGPPVAHLVDCIPRSNAKSLPPGFEPGPFAASLCCLSCLCSAVTTKKRKCKKKRKKKIDWCSDYFQWSCWDVLHHTAAASAHRMVTKDLSDELSRDDF